MPYMRHYDNIAVDIRNALIHKFNILKMLSDKKCILLNYVL